MMGESMRKTHQLTRLLFASLTSILLLFGGYGTAMAAHAKNPPRHILILNSYHQPMTWVDNIVRAIYDELQPDQNNLVLHVENMDTKRFHSPAYLQSLFQAYRAKYQQTRFDLILSSDNNAFDFLRRYRDELFPGVPVAFCGVNYFQQQQLTGHRGYTGVEEVFDAAATLRIALKNHPKTREVLVINDYLKTGRAWEKTIRQQLVPFAGQVKLNYVDNLSLTELEQQIAALPKDSILLLGVYFSDREGRYVTYERIGSLLARASKVPVYCLLEFNIGTGVIGGNVISGYYQGQAVARLGKKILRGEAADQIPVLHTGANRNIFDYQQLQRFSVVAENLPTDSIIVNRPDSAYQKYRTIIWLTIGFISLLLLTIIALTINIRLRHKAELQLSENEQKLRGLFDQTFELLGLLSPEGILLDANQTSLKFIGGIKSEVIGKPFWETPWWNHHPEVQQQIRDGITRAANGETVHFETFHKAADGSIHTFDFSLRPLHNDNGEIIYLIPEGRDISERIEMEQALSRSEERLSTALRAANDGLWDWHIDTDDNFYDPTYFTMVGYEPEEFPASIGEFIKRIHPDDRERVKNDIDAHIEGKNPQYRSEFRFRHKDGSWRWILSRGEIVEYNDGKPVRMLGIHSDITEHKENEYQLYKAQSYIRNILDSMPSLIISVDPDGRITQWNMEAEKVTGTSATEARGKLLSEVMPQLKNQMEQVRTALKDRQPHRQTKVASNLDNQAQFSDITVYPLVANGVDGAVIRVDDVTERVRLEEMMIQSEKMLSVGGLAAGMAHEINNPLAGILQSSQVLLNRLHKKLPKGRIIAEELGIDPEKITRYLEQMHFEKMLTSIHDSGQRAARIVENVLSFSRKSDSVMRRQDLPLLVDKTLELATNDFDLKSKYDFRKVEIVRIYEKEIQQAACDATQIQQVLLNLLRNGSQAMWTAETGRSPQFTLCVRQEAEEAVIEVADNGPGMEAELCKRIFEPFFTTKEVGEGTGLGLSVSYFIITEHHQGSMEVESTPGAGTRFTIRLPFVQSQENHA